ncbi:S8 family serine peptidase [Streptomyces sp. 4F14]|uniref:S8 family serine peptidase n=1 Tax=Streptomyces sp. 4F14 TaxID=3394380 RepID=UPI003A8A18C4
MTNASWTFRAVATGFALAAVMATSLTSAAARPAEPTPTSPERRTYVVKLADAPVAAYEGGLPGLRRTMPAPGERLDTASAATAEYLRHLDRRRDAVLETVPGAEELYAYDYTFNGFAARLTAVQAEKLAGTRGVVSVKLSKARPPQDRQPAQGDTAKPAPATPLTAGTPRAAGTQPVPAALPDIPRLLGLSGEHGLWSKLGGPQRAGEGMIVGVIDAFDPGNPSLAPLPEPRPDADVIARKWRGGCDTGEDSAGQYKVTCNNKVIGAAWFREGVADPQPIDVPSPMDMHSRGTHIGTTIAGAYDVPAVIPETNARGRISGLAPAARLAFYKTCWSTGCADADDTAAIDRAVADGVDIISYSIAGALTDSSSVESMFNAAKAGVFVAADASGGGVGSVANTAPWITTVASQTHDTVYEATLVLGDGQRVTAPAHSTGIPKAPLVNAVDVSRAGAENATFCPPGTLDPAKTRGKIVVCDRGGPDTFTFSDRVDEVRSAGAVALVLTNTPTSAQDPTMDWEFPLLTLDARDRDTVKAYAAGPDATAEITPSAGRHVRERAVARFSAAGPDAFSGGDLLKPDIAAPGVLVPGGTVPHAYAGYQGEYGFMDGTSTPHITGLAVLLKQLRPDWSPMEIKSALMTTATSTDDTGRPIQKLNWRGPETDSTPLDRGSGSPRVTRAVDPGLVYDSTPADWTAYLCAIGTPPAPGACATVPRTDPSDLNYPSVSVGDLDGAQTVTRTVTNVGRGKATYRAALRTPPGYEARVTPQTLTLAPGESASYRVELVRGSAPVGEWAFGSLTWSDGYGGHRVTSPVAVRAAS